MQAALLSSCANVALRKGILNDCSSVDWPIDHLDSFPSEYGKALRNPRTQQLIGDGRCFYLLLVLLLPLSFGFHAVPVEVLCLISQHERICNTSILGMSCRPTWDATVVLSLAVYEFYLFKGENVQPTEMNCPP